MKKKKTVVRRNEEMDRILQSPILLRMGGVGWSVRIWVGGFIECVDGLGLVGKFQKIASSLQSG